MKDLIDLANLVFDQLVKDHNEIEESRALFLYSTTMDQTFFIIGSNKSININGSGVSKNFEDSVIDSLDQQWKSQIQAHKSRIASEIARSIKEPQKQPNDGDIFNFWGNEGEWREIKF